MTVETIGDLIVDDGWWYPRIVSLAGAILKLCPSRRFLMRAPLRVFYKTRGNRATRHNTHYLNDDLHTLEKLGIVLRHPAYVEIIDREALVFVSRIGRGSSLSPEP